MPHTAVWLNASSLALRLILGQRMKIESYLTLIRYPILEPSIPPG